MSKEQQAEEDSPLSKEDVERMSRFSWGSDDIRSLVIQGERIKSEKPAEPPEK